MSVFKTSFAANIFHNKYAIDKNDTWEALSERVIKDVCEGLLPKSDCDQLVQYIKEMKFIPGGRYLYYAGRKLHAWNNCYLLKGEEDSREEWGNLLKRASDCLMCGGGIGIDYSVFRPRNATLGRTGGKASGPIPLMYSINEIGRNVMQGGSRRSAIYASLNWQHADVQEFLYAKDWHKIPVGVMKKYSGKQMTIKDVKYQDFNFHAPLDMTNISLNYDDAWLHETELYAKHGQVHPTYLENVRQALKTGEPGFSFNFGAKEKETLRNACTEVTSEDDSDVCNLGSINMGNIDSLNDFRDVVSRASRFLLCGTIRADLPYEKVRKVREKNRRLGLGLMGVHEWLLKRNYKYEMNKELERWLFEYECDSTDGAKEAARQSVSCPAAFRAIAPTGTIGILASTTTGIEPLYACAFRRRYLTEGTRWKFEYVVDATADRLIKEYGLKPEGIETAASLAKEPEKRIKFQADIQDYVDMAISSTINLPPWDTEYNNEDHVLPFAKILAKYAPRLRGFTCYPDGSRGGQPITEVPYEEALKHKDMVYDEVDQCKGGVCGI